MPDQRALIVSCAQDFVRRGTPYLWGGRSNAGVDCSGLVQICYYWAGIELGRTTWDQFAQCREVSAAEALPGDLVFFDIAGRTDHVGIVSAPGMMIDAPSEGHNVTEEAIWASYPLTYARHPALDVAPDPAPASPLQPGLCAHVAASGGLNLRTGPGLQQPTLGLLPAGSTVLLSDQRQQADGHWWRWCCAFALGTLDTGWVAESYLTA